MLLRIEKCVENQIKSQLNKYEINEIVEILIMVSFMKIRETPGMISFTAKEV